MTDKISQDLQRTHPHDARQQSDLAQRTADVPVRLVRGNASPEELSALIAVVAVLASADSDGDESEPEQTDRLSWGSGTSTRSRWGSPARMIRTTHHHGPGGWRASTSPR